MVLVGDRVGDRVSILFPGIRESRNAQVEKFLAVMVVSL